MSSTQLSTDGRCAATALPAALLQRCQQVVAYVRPGMPDVVLPGHRHTGTGVHSLTNCRTPIHTAERSTNTRRIVKTSRRWLFVSLNRSRRSQVKVPEWALSLFRALPLWGTQTLCACWVSFGSPRTYHTCKIWQLRILPYKLWLDVLLGFGFLGPVLAIWVMLMPRHRAPGGVGGNNGRRVLLTVGGLTGKKMWKSVLHQGQKQSRAASKTALARNYLDCTNVVWRNWIFWDEVQLKYNLGLDKWEIHFIQYI